MKSPLRLNKLRKKLKRRGNIIVLSAIMMIMVFGFTSFVVDVGFISLTQAQLEVADDAAVLAAALELPAGIGRGATKTSGEVRTLATAAAVDVAGRHRAGEKNTVYADGNRDVRFGQVVWDPIAGDWQKSWGTAPYNMVEVTLRRNTQVGASDGPLPLFFGAVIGHRHANLSAKSTAALIPAAGFRLPEGSSETIDVLPFALDLQTWENLMQGISEIGDQYRYVSSSGTVSTGPDGIKELNLYPHSKSTMPPGNRGTVDFGSSNNSTADIARQIVYGLNAEDLAYFGGELRWDEPFQVNGDTGISAGVKDELESIKGKPRAIPIFSEVHGPGNNAMYTIVKFVGIRILNVKLTGNPKHVIVQPAPFVAKNTVRSETGVIDENSVFTKPVLLP